MSQGKPWEGREPTKEDAEVVGTRLATLVAAEVVSQPVRGSVSNFISLAEDLDTREEDGVDLYELAWNTFISVFRQLMEASTDGIKARTEMSQQLMEDAAAARKLASELAMEAVRVQDIKQAPRIEAAVRMANESLAAANKLFDPVQTNINQLIETAKGVEIMEGMQNKARAQLEDKAHDHKCDDPDCPGHTNH
jgi:hypothetical protein